MLQKYVTLHLFLTFFSPKLLIFEVTYQYLYIKFHQKPVFLIFKQRITLSKTKKKQNYIIPDIDGSEVPSECGNRVRYLSTTPLICTIASAVSGIESLLKLNPHVLLISY